jgi:hypothetical protein
MLPLVTAAGLFSANMYTVYVSTDGNKINYRHQKGRGIHGHQFVVHGDTVTWTCDTPSGTFGCTAVAVKFKTISPCTISANSCMVPDTNTDDFTPYPYSIAVSFGSKLVVDDPEVIVDNSGTLILTAPPATGPGNAQKKKK